MTRARDGHETVMRVLVTGATGVLGRRVLPLLVAGGHEVTAVAREKPDRVRNAGAAPVALDLFDAAAVRTAVAGCDAVIDVATHIPPTARMALPSAWHDNDRLRGEASRHLADAVLATDARRYVRESFFLVYADGGDRWLDESARVSAPPLTASALVAESNAGRVTQLGGEGVALRFGMFYGHDSVHTRDLVRTAERFGVAALPGDPDGFESWVHLDDAAAAVVAALGVPPGVYNVADDEPLRRRDHAAALGQALGRSLRLPPRRLARLGPLRQRDRSTRLDTRRFRDAGGWRPGLPSVRAGWPQVLAAG